MQDLQKLTDKLNLLEDLIQNEEDSSSLQGLLQNPTIRQMYQNCRSELPKLLELTDSDGLNEDLMNRIINITERLMKIKSAVEDDVNTETRSNQIELHQSTDQLTCNNNCTGNPTNAVFDDLPLLSPNPNKQEQKQSISITRKSFKYNNDILIDSFQLSNSNQFITRFMNISTRQLKNLKLDGKFVKSTLDPFETFITVKSDVQSVEYNEGEVIELDRPNGQNKSANIIDEVGGIENLLLI